MPEENSESGSSASGASDLKDRGNKAFADGDFVTAEQFYRDAISVDDTSHILYTNLAAALLSQSKFHEALDAANEAIRLDHTWLKAHFRKATALESLGRLRESFEAWQIASDQCEHTTWLAKQFETSKRNWQKVMKTTQIDSIDDMMNRYALLKDSREKLSTLAHFWNISSQEERLAHFRFFLNMISGGGGLPAQAAAVTVDMMMPMPMHNYEDLPRANIEPWCAFFESCDPAEKTLILEQIWNKLSGKEQNDVVMDMRLFIGQAVERASFSSASATEEKSCKK